MTFLVSRSFGFANGSGIVAVCTMNCSSVAIDYGIANVSGVATCFGFVNVLIHKVQMIHNTLVSQSPV